MKNHPLSLLQTSLFGILFLYLFIGLFLGITNSLGKKPKRQEIFPIFSWFLFHKVPKEEITVYTIIIHEHNGKIFDPGIPFEKADSSMRTKNYGVANSLLRDMGNSYQKNQQEKFNKLRQIFESNILKGSIKYELVRQEYSLLERYQTTEFKKDKTSLSFFDNYKNNEQVN